MTSSAPNPNGQGVVPTPRNFHYTFNSATRNSGEVETPEFRFKDDERINFASIRVRKVILPMTFHNVIQDVNDTLSLVITTTQVGTGNTQGYSFEYKVPPGLYRDMTEVWGAMYRSSTPSGPHLYVTHTTGADYVAATLIEDGETYVDLGMGVNHVSIRFSWVPTAGWKVSKYVFGGNAYRLFGMSSDGVNQSVTRDEGTVNELILMPYPPDLMQAMRTVNIESNLSFGHMYSTTRSNMVSVVERVPLQSGIEGSVIEYEPPNQSGFLVEGFSRFSRIRFELRDNLNRRVDLHNHDWSIELVVTEL